MIKLIGSGGHAKVVQEVIDTYPFWLRRTTNAVFFAIGNNRDRSREVRYYYGKLPFTRALVHPSAIISPTAVLGAGTIVMAGAVVQAHARVGRHCIINTGASVDHDCIIEDFVHIAPGVHLCGGVHVGEGSLLSVGLGFAPNAKIEPWTFVKAKRIDFEPIPGD